MWKVIAEPQGKNPGIIKKAAVACGVEKAENTGGVIVYVTNGDNKQEVSRVAYIRRPDVCKNPNVTYQDQLDIEITRARDTCTKLNELLGEPDEVPA